MKIDENISNLMKFYPENQFDPKKDLPPDEIETDPKFIRDLEDLLYENKTTRSEFYKYWKENPGEKNTIVTKFVRHKEKVLLADIRFGLEKTPEEFIARWPYYENLYGLEFIKRAFKRHYIKMQSKL